MKAKRRNLTPDQASLIRGRMYNRMKKSKGEPDGNANAAKQKSQSDTVVSDTASVVAERSGVSRATVMRDAKRAEALDKLAETGGSVI